MLLWNRTSQVAIDQCKDNDSAKPVETIADAVAPSDIVWSCLADEEAVLSVYGEICKGDIMGKLFVECSTITASGTEKVAQQLKDKGAEFVTMPVFGEPGTASAGNLIVVPAGPAAAVDRIRPYLEGWGIWLVESGQEKSQL
ncbi:hypothetical protein ZTR_06333 [Talaromyces verruculosus]|nr:hypothetical protein ZTR_06333 [Talaromyces verruculosus]